MQRDEVIDLLAIVQATDNREVGPVDVNVWVKMIGHLDRDECADAIMEFRAQQPGVWLEPGHIAARVKARHRDELDRMDPDERALRIADAAIAAQQGFARYDEHGFIDKSVPDLDDEYPEDWTTEQRLNASWAKVDAFRERAEYAMAVGRPSQLLTQPPASAETRARALAQFAAHQGTLDGGEVAIDESIPHVNALHIRCPFCKAAAGDRCTMPGMSVGVFSKPGSKKTYTPRSAERHKLASFHPSRVQAAALAEGYDQGMADAIVAVECGRQVSRAKQGWSARDFQAPVMPAMPIETDDSEPIDVENRAGGRGRE